MRLKKEELQVNPGIIFSDLVGTSSMKKETRVREESLHQHNSMKSTSSSLELHNVGLTFKFSS